MFYEVGRVQIVNTNYSMTTETLRQLPGILSVGMQAFRPDMFLVFSLPTQMIPPLDGELLRAGRLSVMLVTVGYFATRLDIT